MEWLESGRVSRMGDEVATVDVESEASSPSIEEVKYGELPYRFCEPVLLRRWMYGMESDQP